MRGEVQTPLEVIRSATSTAAELLNLTGEIGTLAVGAHADLLVVDGDPLADLGVLAEPKHFRHIIQGGAVVSGT
ncbi:amidohydrolase family protein [Streptomyces sp. NBC_01304]|nr:amidohydrolase family protein [Streptomyces sp. NBC_01304]